MYSKQQYTGADLPFKHLSLTYDDGPGNYTLDIAKFLFEEKIQATFFVVGKYAVSKQETLQQLLSLGHLVGNHTYEHPDMPYFLSKSGDLQNQILRTDAIIKRFIENDTIYFRAPYGKWSTEVSNELNFSILCTAGHIGPVHWDVGGIDCHCWKNGLSVDETINIYLHEISEKKRGIVVMHDEIADMEFLKTNNKTLELTKKLIPKLKLQGYKFVRLDEIESIRKAAEAPLKFRLRANNSFVKLLIEEGSFFHLNGRKKDDRNEFTISFLDNSKIAVKASNNLFLSVDENNNRLRATGKQLTGNELFDIIPVSSNKLVLRAYNGRYITTDKKNRNVLVAEAEHMRQAKIFSFSPIEITSKKQVNIVTEYKKIKRQLLFIRSKIKEVV